MRILMVSEDIPSASMGGLAKHVLGLARALIGAGHVVDILGNRECAPEAGGSEMQFGGLFLPALDGYFTGWKERQLGLLMPPRRGWLARHFARAILRHAEDYDVVHYHGHVPNVAAFLPDGLNFIQTRHDQGSDCVLHTRFRDGAPCRAVAPQECAGCLRAQPNAVQRRVSGWAVQRYRDQVAASFRRHKTLFVSDLLRHNLTRTLGPGDWGATLHNFVDRASIDTARATILPPPQARRLDVLVAGKLIPAKGIEAFLAATVPQLPTRMHIHVAGDGPAEAQLRRRYNAHGRIHLHGWLTRDKTLRLAAACHAVAVPSLWEEPFGSTVLEGLLMGKPVYALARGGTPEMAPYALAPGQLHLFDSLPLLASALASTEAFRDYGAAPPGLGDAGPLLPRLLQAYRLPPGPLSADALDPRPPARVATPAFACREPLP